MSPAIGGNAAQHRSRAEIKASLRVAAVLVGLLYALYLLLPLPAGAQADIDPYPEDIVDPRAPVNGCGSQGEDGTDVPDDWFGSSFTGACNWHDRCYGTKGLSQSYCDRGMFDKTIRECAGDERCEAVATVYYVGVSTFGGDPYRAGQEAGCDRTPHRDSRVHGDPHLATFDGVFYDLMTAGEFTLIRDADGHDAVQARFFPTQPSFTVVTGIAVRLGDSEAVVQLDTSTSELVVFMDGVPVTSSFAAVEAGFIELGEKLEGVNQVVTIRRDDGLRVEGVVFRDRIDVGINVFESQWGAITGLLGNADDDPDNDLIRANGELIDTSDVMAPSFVRGLYDSGFAEDWRVDPDDSMFIPGSDFDYHGDEARSWPLEIITLETFLGEGVEAARRQCREAGLEGTELTDCMFDVLASGDDSYAETAALSSTRATAVASPDLVVSADAVQGTAGEAPDAETVANSPLVDAILAGDADEVMRLIETGENVDATSERHALTPVIAAVVTGNDEILSQLLDAGADPNVHPPSIPVSPLARAAAAGSLEMVEQLLDAGALPDGPVTGEGGLTPLGAAGNAPDVMARLLDAGADPDGVSGTTPPLYVVAGSGQLEAAEMLVEAGATVDVDGDPGPGQQTPLVVAVFGQRVDMVRYLLEAGANPNIRLSDGVPLSDFAFTDEMRELLGG